MPDDSPIPGPTTVGPEYEAEPDWDIPMTFPLKLGRTLADMVRTPVHWIRKNLIEPNRGPKYYWYHKQYKRALPIDECYMDDHACIYEANLEYKRNFMVDRATLDILRYRRDNCNFWQLTKKGVYRPQEECEEITKTYDENETNFFIKYGDLHFCSTVVHAFNKQKHRMIMERRRAILREKGELKEERY